MWADNSFKRDHNNWLNSFTNFLTKHSYIGTSKHYMLKGCMLFCFPLDLSIHLLESKYWAWHACYCSHPSIQQLFLAWLSDNIVWAGSAYQLSNKILQAGEIFVITLSKWMCKQLQYDRIMAEKACPDSRLSSCTEENHMPTLQIPFFLQNKSY